MAGHLILQICRVVYFFDGVLFHEWPPRVLYEERSSYEERHKIARPQP